jgi:hypothetical protein
MNTFNFVIDVFGAILVFRGGMAQLNNIVRKVKGRAAIFG